MIRPIIFSADEVRATLDGRKRMMRRAVKKKYGNTDLVMRTDKYGTRLVERQNDAPPDEVVTQADGVKVTRRHLVAVREIEAPYHRGDVLWVREKWRTVDYEYCDGKWSASIQCVDGAIGSRVFWYDNSDVGILDDCIYSKTGWRSPIYMPKAACRLFLRVTDVRVERVQDITETDAIREGTRPAYPYMPNTTEPNLCKYREGFYGLWNSINAKRAGGIYAWDRNPWVWVISFERCDAPEGWPG